MGLFTFVPERLVVVDDRHRKAGKERDAELHALLKRRLMD